MNIQEADEQQAAQPCTSAATQVQKQLVHGLFLLGFPEFLPRGAGVSLGHFHLADLLPAQPHPHVEKPQQNPRDLILFTFLCIIFGKLW